MCQKFQYVYIKISGVMDQAQLKGIQKVLDPTTGKFLPSHNSTKFYPTKHFSSESLFLLKLSVYYLRGVKSLFTNLHTKVARGPCI